MSLQERDAYLFSLYKKSKLDSLGFHPGEVNERLGYNESKLNNVISRLEYEGLIEGTTTSLTNITALGIDYVESRSSDPEVQRRKQLRLSVLREFYNHRDKPQGITREDIHNAVEISEEDLEEIIRYLLKKRLILHPHAGPYFKISFSGIDSIEDNIL